MPQLPKAVQTLSNGMHTLISLETKTTRGEYGDQEEITCLEEGTQDTMTRVWISHTSRKKIEAAAAAGLVRIDQLSEEWDVVLGARFQAFIAGGKIVGITAAPVAPLPIQATLPPVSQS